MDSEIAPLMDRLAEALPGWPDDLPPEWEAFRALSERRHAHGRELYGDAYVGRDNPAEAIPEASDGLVYCSFAHAEEGERDIDLLLTAALRFYEAYVALQHYRAKRGGAPA